MSWVKIFNIWWLDTRKWKIKMKENENKVRWIGSIGISVLLVVSIRSKIERYIVEF